MAQPKFSTTGGANQTTPYDPNKRKLPNLPYMQGDDPTSVLPLTNTALNQPQAQVQQVQPMQPQVQGMQQARSGAMQTLLNKAQAPQQQSPLQSLVTQKTQSYVQDPTLGFDSNKYKQTQLSNFDAQQAKLFESMRQKFADVADTGTFRKDALQNQLQGLRDRRTLESDLDYESRDFNQNALINALAQGRATESMNQDILNRPIDNLVKALGATEGEAQRVADVEQREDVQRYQTRERLGKEGYEAQQADLDRQASIALQQGDIAGQERIANLKSELDLRYLEETQGFQQQQNELDRRLQLAIQNNDITAQKEITTLKANLDMAMQIQTQGFEATQAQLNRNLQESLQSNDIEATRENLGKQLAMDKYKADQGVALTREQNALNRALEVTLENMGAETQKAVVSLKGKIDEGLMIKDQEWKSVESDLDRKQQEFLAQGDWKNAREIETLKGEIQASAQKTQNEWADGQRIATQAYNTATRLSAQDFEKGMKYLESELLDKRANGDMQIAKELKTLDAQIYESQAIGDATRARQLEGYRSQLQNQAAYAAFQYTKEGMQIQAQLEEAQATNDFARTQQLEAIRAQNAETFAKSRAAETEVLQEQQFGFEWKMQNNELNHDQAMRKLDFELQTARANGDVVRQKQIMAYQAQIDFNQMRTQNGYDVAMTNLRAGIDSAMARKDFVYATQLKQQELDAMVNESTKDRALEWAEIAMQRDAQAWSTYTAMKNSGAVEDATKYMQQRLGQQGIEFNPVDAYESAKNAIATDFKLEQQQWLQTHDSLEGFNEFYNNSIYGDKSEQDRVDELVTGQFTYQQLKADPQKMDVAINNAVPWSETTYRDKEGKNMVKFSSVPEKSVPFETNGETYIRTGDPYRRTQFGYDWQAFEAINLTTGKPQRFTAKG